MNIKTNTSVALPVWTCDLGAEEGGRWDGLADVEMEDDESGSEDESSEEEEAKRKKAVEDSNARALFDEQQFCVCVVRPSAAD